MVVGKLGKTGASYNGTKYNSQALGGGVHKKHIFFVWLMHTFLEVHSVCVYPIHFG